MVQLAPMSERRGVAEMIGEWAREASVLIAVFGMLDKLVFAGGPSPGWTAAVLVVALFSFAIGVTIERRR